MFLKLRSIVLNFSDFVKAISRAKKRPHTILAYFSAELKTPDNLLCYTTNVRVMCLMHNGIGVY